MFAGNPGSGKSTIANTLIGRPLFESGVSLGAGLTTALHSVEHGGEIYSDTPGLDDIRVREQAAREISAGLTHARRLRLVFVCTLEEGRVRPSDVVTIETILEAVAKVGVSVDAGFSLIVNKCNVGELRAIEHDADSRMLLVRTFGCGHRLEHVYFAPKCSQAEGLPNTLLPFDAELCAFLGAAPVLEMPGVPVNVDMSHYQERLNDLMRQISDLKALLNDIQRTGQRPNLDRMVWSKMVQSAAFAIGIGILKRSFPSIMQFFA